jgi:hypothetical protein
MSFNRTAVPPIDCALSVPLCPWAVEFSFAAGPAPLCVEVAVAVCDSEFDALLAGFPVTEDAALPLGVVVVPDEVPVEFWGDDPVAVCGDVLLFVGFAHAEADAPNANATAVAIRVRFIKRTPP